MLSIRRPSASSGRPVCPHFVFLSSSRRICPHFVFLSSLRSARRSESLFPSLLARRPSASSGRPEAPKPTLSPTQTRGGLRPEGLSLFALVTETFPLASLGLSVPKSFYLASLGAKVRRSKGSKSTKGFKVDQRVQSRLS